MALAVGEARTARLVLPEQLDDQVVFSVCGDLECSALLAGRSRSHAVAFWPATGCPWPLTSRFASTCAVKGPVPVGVLLLRIGTDATRTYSCCSVTNGKDVYPQNEG